MVPATVRISFTVKLPVISRGPIVVGAEIVTSPLVTPPLVPSLSHPAISASDIGKSWVSGSACDVSQDLLFPDPAWQYMVPVTVEPVMGCACAHHYRLYR